MKRQSIVILLVLLVLVKYSFNFYADVNVTKENLIVRYFGNDDRTFNSHRFFYKNPKICYLADYNLTPHEPLFITDETIDDYGFPGDGTAENPYIIEYLNITVNDTNSSDELYGIRILGLTKFLIIQHCYISVVGDTNASNEIYGIRISSFIKPLIIQHCYISVRGTNSYPSSCGIRAYSSEDGCPIRISENYFETASYGLDMQYLISSEIVNNTFLGKGKIYLHLCSGVSIANNTFQYSKSLRVGDSEKITIENNTFIATDVGIDLFSVSNSTIRSNLLINCSTAGLRLAYPSYLNFTNNKLYRCGLAIYEGLIGKKSITCRFENNTVNDLPLAVFINLREDNYIIDGHYGQIVLINCSSIIITNQYFAFSQNAIYLQHSFYISIVNSTFYKNLGSAIYVDSGYIFICNNSFIANECGIYAYDTYHFIVSYNTFCNQTSEAISSFETMGAVSAVHHNNFINNNINGSHQIGDKVRGTFYDRTTGEGNYWSDWDGDGAYAVNDEVQDPFPFASPVDWFRGEFEYITKTYYGNDEPFPFLAIVMIVAIIGALTYVYFRFFKRHN